MLFYRRFCYIKKSIFCRCLFYGVGSVLLVAALFGAYAGILQLTGNFHAVKPGVFYRSAQPSAEQIRDYQNRYGIQSIVNLRGDNTGSPWYDDEVSAAKNLGIAHINFRMSARRELTLEKSIELVEILKNAPKPVLVHCNGGSDRSGLASAVYLGAVEKTGESIAEGQLSLRFGHVPVPYLSSAFAMDRTFENLEAWLGYSGS